MTSELPSNAASADGTSPLSNAVKRMRPAIKDTAWLDQFRDSMLKADSFRACLTLGASWLCEWIDKGLALMEAKAMDVGGYRQFCLIQAGEVEAWQGDEEELWVWAWSSAAELLEFYELGAHFTHGELAERLCRDCDDPEINDKEGYARHLIVSALAFIHGWSHQSLSDGR